MKIFQKYTAQFAAIGLIFWSAWAQAASLGVPAQFQQGLRVKHYGLSLTFNPAERTISGMARIELYWTDRLPTHLAVDMGATLQPDAVTFEGAPVDYVHRQDRLVVALPKNLAGKKMYVLQVKYRGTPNPHVFRFDSIGVNLAIASYGLPYSAMQWWPSLDSPAYKAESADIFVTAPAGDAAVSNGVLVSVKALNGGQHQYHWHEGSPIYPDVLSVDIGPYTEIQDVYRSIAGKVVPLTYYVYAADKGKAESEFRVVKEILRTYETLFGPYPFRDEKYGIAEMPIASFREHQTIPALGRGLILGTSPVWDVGNVANVIAHDMAHQWFGDSLTPKDWSDVWLNEGFANYAVALWREKTEGHDVYLQFMRGLEKNEFAGAVLIKPDESPGNLLTYTTFNKGAWVLHMLRHVMGDHKFFMALHTYVKANNGGLVDTETWLAVCQRVYGQPLSWFFDEWVYGMGRPALKMTWKQRMVDRTDRLQLVIDQTQAGQTFIMPIDIELLSGSENEIRTVWVKQRRQQFQLEIKHKITGIVLDPNGWLLKH